MPYSTERGVTSYSDRDAPAEYASGADEDRASYNEAQDAAHKAADKLAGLLDELYEPTMPDLGEGHAVLASMGGQILALIAEAERLLGRSTRASAQVSA